MSPAPIVVIAHEATRTGSPRVLLDLLRHAATRLDHPLAVRLLARGGLADELDALTAPHDPGRTPALVLVNSSLAADRLAEFPPPVPAVVYVHEQGDALAQLPPQAVEQLTGRADRVLCVSPECRADLVDLGVAEDRIVVLPPPIVERPRPSDAEVSAARQEMGGRAGRRLVVGCGVVSWRKGTDLFVAAGRELRRRRDDVDLAWIGRGNRSMSRILRVDSELADIADRLRWIDEVAATDAYLAAADVLLVSSREDPQPLVVGEAAMMGTPTVAFDISGLGAWGAVGAVGTAPYPDVSGVADLVEHCLDDAAAGTELVSSFRREVGARRSLDVIGDRFVSVVVEAMAAGARP